MLKRPKGKYQFVRSQLHFFATIGFSPIPRVKSESQNEKERKRIKENARKRERERIKENVKKNQRKKRKGEKEIGEQLHRATRKSRIHHDVNATLTRLTGG